MLSITIKPGTYFRINEDVYVYCYEVDHKQVKVVIDADKDKFKIVRGSYVKDEAASKKFIRSERKYDDAGNYEIITK